MLKGKPVPLAPVEQGIVPDPADTRPVSVNLPDVVSRTPPFSSAATKSCVSVARITELLLYMNDSVRRNIIIMKVGLL